MIRRRYQLGSLQKRGNAWRYRYRVDMLDENGKVSHRQERAVSFGKVTRKEAVAMRDDFVRKHGLDASRPVVAMTLSAFWTSHFEPKVVQKKSHHTQKLYAQLFHNHVEPTLGGEALCDLTRYAIEDLMTQKEKQGLSSQTVHHIHGIVSKMLGKAKFWGWIEENWASGVTLPQVVRQRSARALTLEEVRLIGGNLREPARTVFVLGVAFGLRIGELLGLEVADLDFDAELLHVRRSATRGTLNPTKTPEGVRNFYLPPFISQLLKAYMLTRRTDSPWLFPTRRGGFHNDRTFWIRFVKPTADRLGLPHWSWHSMRRTFLTHNGNRGVAMPILQSLAGHTNPQTTMRYIDPFAEEKQKVLEAWSDRLWPEKLRPLAASFEVSGAASNSQLVD
jgi:integrase